MNNTLDVFLDALKELMDENSLNQKQLAEKIYVKPSSIVYWFNKTFCPRINNLIKISNLFNCSIDYLLGLTDVKKFEPSKNPANFIERFNMFEQKNNLNDNKISKYCKIGNSTVSKWRKYNRYPETQVVLKLVELFGCSIEYLIGRSNKI